MTVNSNIYISTTQKKLPVNERKICRLISHIAKAEKVEIEYVEIAIVGKKAMASFNFRHLSHSGATDVISFDLADSDNKLCAQLIVCSDVAISQSKKNSNTPETELLLYITHGTLHAIGYDDHAEEDYRQMHTRENQLLKEFGLGENIF